MAECTDCGNKEKNCGCTKEGLTINDVCNPIVCESDECSESFDAECIIYSSDDIVCNDIVIVTAGQSMAQAVANIVAYFCTQLTVDADIICGNTTVVTAGTSINDALDQIVTYFCNEIGLINAELLDINNAITTINNTLITLQGQDVTGTTVTAVDSINIDGCVTRTWELTITGSSGTLATTTWSSPAVCPPIDLCALPPLEAPDDNTNFIVCQEGIQSTESQINYNDLFDKIQDDLTLSTSLSYGLFAQTADSTPVVDPGAGSLVGAGVGSLSIPANTFQVGDSFRVKLAGHITCSNTQELTIFGQDGNGNIIFSTGLIDLRTSTNGNWNLEVDFTIRSLGVTGGLVGAGVWSYIPNSAGQALEGSDFSTVGTINTTIDNTLEIIASFNLDESGANTIYSELFTLTKTY